MSVDIIKSDKISEGASVIYICSSVAQLEKALLSEKELVYIRNKKELNADADLFVFDRLGLVAAVLFRGEKDTLYEQMEVLRRKGARLLDKLKEELIDEVFLADLSDEPSMLLALAEGIMLAAYQFSKYKTEKKEPYTLHLNVVDNKISSQEINELKLVVEAVFLSRDLVNEPVSTLNAEKLGQIILETARDYGFEAEVFNKKKIEALKMGGLLAVNQGSIDPPTFSVLEWKPENARNKKPVVLVGKGVVFDTGGTNLKTPPGSLDTMKSDMGGAAAVIGALTAIAANKLPVYVIGLIPATDNRIGGNAIVPGDIITMHSGTTVEIMNTDAEGRLILADALSFSKKYEPQLVIDLATLTGSAVMAIGSHGTVAMGTATEEVKQSLSIAGEKVCERLAWFPFWKDYDDALKSEVADMKNIGGREAGAITAGKFLSRFIDAPWIHLDIAGPAFLEKKEHYKGIGGTGVGVRLLYHFLKDSLA